MDDRDHTHAPTHGEAAIRMRLEDRKLVPVEATWKTRTLGWARRIVRSPGKLREVLFTSDRAARPFGVMPGFGAELTVALRGPADGFVHVYADSTPLLGDTHLAVTEAQAVTLDADGRGSATVQVAPEDVHGTGQGRVRILAVDPSAPDSVAAMVPNLDIAQEGTGTIVASALMAFVIFGMAAQVFFVDTPILAVMIVLALAFLIWNTPRLPGARFEIRRLLPLRRRLVAAALVLAGFAIWSLAMTANLFAFSGSGLAAPGLVDPGLPACGEAANLSWAQDCTPTDTLVDNITAIIASFGLAVCVTLALAPAIRPRRLVGLFLLLGAVAPLLIYDLTLLSSAPDAQVSTVAVAGSPTEPGYWTVSWRNVPLSFRISKGLTVAFPVFGWLLAVYGLLGLMVWQRIGTGRIWALTGGVAALATAFQFWFAPAFGTAAADSEAYFFARGRDGIALWTLLACTPLAMALRAGLYRLGRRHWLRILLFGLVYAALAGGLGWAIDVVGPTIFDPDAGSIAALVFGAVLPFICLVLAEVAFWRRRRRRRVGAAPTSADLQDAPEPATRYNGSRKT